MSKCRPRLHLTCTASPMEYFKVIRRKLSKASETHFDRVNFVVTAPLDVPEDAFGAIKTKRFELSCSDRSTPLIIHADAFIHCDATSLTIKECDLRKTSFAFLSQFSDLQRLRIINSSIKEVLEMPYLLKLTEISFEGSTNLEKWYNSSQTLNLKLIVFNQIHDLDDGKMDSILTSMTENFIYPKLATLRIEKSGLTRVPPLVSIFPALGELHLSGNPIKTLAAGSIQKGSTKLNFLDLSKTGLTTIEPGAFVGNFSSTVFSLHSNAMTSFPSAVFKDLLKSMVLFNDSFGWRHGSVFIDKNATVLDCNLEWLLEDNLYTVVKHVPWVEDLNPEEIKPC